MTLPDTGDDPHEVIRAALYWSVSHLGILTCLVLAVYLAWCLLDAARSYLWRGPGLVALQWRPGDWAVVTGATHGIGHAVAAYLANQGRYNLMLVGRSPERLATVRALLTASTSRSVCTACIDLNITDNGLVLRKMRDVVEHLPGPVSLLVNCAGVCSDAAFVSEISPQMLREQINVNLLAVVQMCQAVMPSMAGRSRGLVIIVGSLYGHRAQPLFTLYSATKRALHVLSRSLGPEGGAGGGVRVRCVAPCLVASDLTPHRRLCGCLSVTPEHYARSVLEMGAAGGGGLSGVMGEDVRAGCRLHALQQLALLLIPDCLYFAIFSNGFLLRLLRSGALDKYIDKE